MQVFKICKVCKSVPLLKAKEVNSGYYCSICKKFLEDNEMKEEW